MCRQIKFLFLGVRSNNLEKIRLSVIHRITRAGVFSMAVIAITFFSPFKALASTHGAGVDVVALEALARELLCNQSTAQQCEEISVSTNMPSKAVVSVEGVILPSDALNDPDQQLMLVRNGLYLKTDGSVSGLPEGAVALNSSAEEVSSNLPIKRFPLPNISNYDAKVVVPVGNN